jgi:Protein of unknown function DUF262/Protein of unknown function (DUF1524)
MKPDTHTVQQLFERDVRYLVPLYQRPYVWDESHQWEPLWDDVSALLSHQENGNLDSLWSHFMGAIVLEQERTAPGEIPRFTVIDGQQRLTTLQLLLAAAASSLSDAGRDDQAALLRELTTNNPLKAKGEDCLKVWPTNINRSAFTAVMAPNGPPEEHDDDPNNLIDEAFAYFQGRTSDYLEGVEKSVNGEGRDEPLTPDDAAPMLRAERLRVTLCDLLKVVSIALETDDNAQVIFETLNARGTPLLALDLVKNAAFAQAARQECDVDALYEQVWRPELDQDYWRELRRQGRLRRPVGELFLMHWLTMKLARLIPATELFATFRQHVLGPETDAEEVIRELCADAAVMRSFDSPKPETFEAEFFAHLEALDAGTVLSVVLLLFRSPEIIEERRHRALRILESWLVRRALMRLTTRNYNQLVPRLVGRLKADLEHADDALLDFLAGGEGEISRWPGDEEFHEFVTQREVYGTVAQPRLVMALAAVEGDLYSNKTDIPDVPTSLSLEHIMPRDWESNWPLESAGAGGLWEGASSVEEATKRREESINRLGNLTIVTSPLNSSLSNSAWATKRNGLNQHSKLLLNVQLVERDEWDERGIAERGEWLADRLVRAWPDPDAI